MTRGIGALLCALALLSSCRGRQDAAVAPVPGAVAADKERISSTAAAHLERTFDELLDTLERSYVYGASRRVDWTALRDRYRTQVRGLSHVAGFATVARAVIADLGDPDVVWQSREERIRAELDYSTRYEGIGTYISFREAPVPRVVILEVVPGSPAERAGLLAHDAVLAIDGAPVLRTEATTVASRIRGPRGTQVRLTLTRPGAGRRELSVTRDRVDLSGVEYPVRSGMVGSTGVGYILFPRAASAGLNDQVIQALQDLRARPSLNGLLLDLRISGTGAFPLEELLTTFANGRLGAAYTASGTMDLVVQGVDSSGSQTLPLGVLVGPDTEGAAEVLSGVLQAVGRALVVGARTPGAVEREQQFGLVDGSRLWVPAWAFRAAGGRELGLEGVVPEVMVGADWDAVSDGADAVRVAAARELVARRAR